METLADDNSPESEPAASSSRVSPAGDLAGPATGTLDLSHNPEALASVEKLGEDELTILGSPPPAAGSSAASLFAVGDFVWVKIKGRPWWPGLVCDPSSTAADHEGKARRRERATVPVACFGEGGTAWFEPSQVKDFFGEFQKMSNQSSWKSFVKAVDDAVDEMRKYLELELTCHCMPQEVRAKTRRGDQAGKLPIVSLRPQVFVERLHTLACDVLEAAGAFEITMLKSWVMAFGKGWTDDSPGYHLRRGLEELVDKIDLDVPAVDLVDSKEDDEEEQVTGSEHKNEMNVLAAKSRKSKKKSMTVLIAEMDLDTVELSDCENFKADEKTGSLEHKEKSEDEKCLDVNNDSAEAEEETGSRKRERKKSKYLSPPYTDLDAGKKSAVSPISTRGEMKVAKKINLASLSLSRGSAADLECTFESNKEEDKGSLMFNIDLIPVHEIASELHYTASDPLHLKWNCIAKAVKGFFSFYRSATYSGGSNFMNYQKYLNESSGKNLNSVNPVMANTCQTGISERNIKDANDGVKTANVTSSSSVLICPEKSKPLKRKMNAKNEVSSGAPANLDGQIVNIQIESRYERKNINSKISSNGESAVMSPDPINYMQPAEEKNETNEKNWKTKGKAGNNDKSADPFRNNIFKFSQEGKARRKRKKAETPSSYVPRHLVSNGTNGLETNSSKQKQQENERKNTRALLLTFKVTPLPSKDELVSTFSKYGTVIEPETELLEESSCARVVFAKSTEAETAYSSSDKSGVFRPPNTTYHLHYVPQSTNSQPPAIQFLKPMLPFIRENLENMISSLTSSSPSKEAGLLDGLKPDARENLVGDMEDLLKKVNLMLNGHAAGASS